MTNTPIIDPEALDKLQLKYGGHSKPEDGMCLLEAVSYFAGESEFNDAPQCVSLFLRNVGIRLNDRLNDVGRQALKPFIPLLLNTAGDGKDDKRRLMLRDRNLRHSLPIVFDALGRTEIAAKLRGLDPVTSEEARRAAAMVVKNARDEARALRDA